MKTGVQRTYNYLKGLDSGFRRNDRKAYLQTFYEIIKFNRTQIYADNRRYKKDAMRIALSDFLCTSVAKKEFPIQLN